MQCDLFADSSSELNNIQLPDAAVSYQESWLTAQQAATLYAALARSLPWRQDTIRLYAREVKIPRLQSWHGESHCVYQYSNLVMNPTPMPGILYTLKQRLSAELDAQFNCVLVNWYRDGQDGMGMHADNEPELGPEPVIASVSLGGERRFSFKHLTTGKRSDISLKNGSLLVMKGKTQQYYHHGLSKTTRPVDGRINLTFRFIANT